MATASMDCGLSISVMRNSHSDGLAAKVARQSPDHLLSWAGSTSTVQRAEPVRYLETAARHRRADAELPGLVACSGNDATLAGATDGQRHAPQAGIIALLDRCVEGVNID